jgi:Immunity protein Imm1
VNLHVGNHLNRHATLQEVESAILGLDGVHHTLLTIELDSGQTLTIGGGPDLFVAEVAEDSVHRWAIIDRGVGDHSVDLVVGGQAVDYPAHLCVGRESVLDAARTFVLESGAKCSHLVWSMET